jgi:hypothetical protein
MQVSLVGVSVLEIGSGLTINVMVCGTALQNHRATTTASHQGKQCGPLLQPGRWPPAPHTAQPAAAAAAAAAVMHGSGVLKPTASWTLQVPVAQLQLQCHTGMVCSVHGACIDAWQQHPAAC